MAADISFTEEEMAIDEGLGYPKAYAKLCHDRGLGPYIHGPPFTFTPYALQPHEGLRAREFDQMFPIIDPKAKPTTKPKLFVRGGLTVPSNLRILQWQVCKKKHRKLEFLVPWWDLQLGISINQFLSIFASANSDFSISLNLNNKWALLRPPVVLSQRESHDASSVLKYLDFNRQLRPNSPLAARKLKPSISKENEIPDMVANPYQAIVMARDSLKQREETVKMQEEIQKLDDEVNEMKHKNEEEKIALQDLELVLIKRRRRAEKCRRLAEGTIFL
ncbi:hypothetical protein L1049_001804 [Liquidambar formosana]|uniref:Uncharacterized protein n=1 Tax=Liquidambar formosana TaxID=63359 RepID=A0AAP0N3Z4_LIQFO